MTQIMPAHTVQITEDSSIVHEITRAVAVVLNRPVNELSPLGETVDTELLQGVVDARSIPSVTCVRVAFEYEGLDITIDQTGELRLEST